MTNSTQTAFDNDPKARKSKAIATILIVCLVAIVVVSAVTIVNKLNSYITENGKENMSTVIEQMEQAYDVQTSGHYSDLQMIESYLFQSGKRSIKTGEDKKFFDALEQRLNGEALFLKENGTATTLDGRTNKMEIQSQLLLDLQNGKNIAKLVSRGDAGTQQDCYLIAIPCDKYYVDGEEYSALGTLYDRSHIDSLLEINGYGGNALVFLLDESGNITYTNQNDDSFFRNYSLLKHMKKDGALTDEQFNALESSIQGGGKGVELLGTDKEPFYLGYTPLKSSSAVLVCIVAKSVANNVLLGYQETMVRAVALLCAMFAILLCVLVFAFYRLRAARQKAVFQEENRKIQLASMEALKAEKRKADIANMSKSDFLTNMSHDIRTPMNAIVGLANLMEHDKDDPALMSIYIHKIQVSSQHLLSLINDVLDMSKIESGEVILGNEPVSLAEQVAQVNSIIRPRVDEHKQTFVIRTHEIAHEFLLGDAVRLRQLLINILSNAVKYTQEGGSISLDMAELPSADNDKVTIEICVTDNGCGMDPEFLKHIFDPFTRAESSTINKVQGTGLGMAITKNIIDLMGGQITAQSQLGKGSRFTVTLPLAIDKDAKHRIDAEKVLLIAHEESLVKNALAAFSTTNVRLWIAKSKPEVESILQETDIDTILLAGHIHDHELAQIVKILREEAQDAVLIICVDYEQDELASGILAQDDVDGLISRPFFFSNFAHVVNQARDGGTGEDEPKGSVFNGMRFLCAEDNDLNAEILDAILDLNGASCTIYPNGKELVDAFEAVKPGDYDAILMDVQMPVMNGLDATRAIRASKNELGHSIPIIAMTANAFSSDIQDCLKSGMDAHVAKPLDITVLERTLKSLLRTRG